jgi:competence ComEA-like helix-hairpin-helix protein
MLTAAERNALLLTLAFLLLGAGAKAWVRAQVELGPFPTTGSAGPDYPTGGPSLVPDSSSAAPALPPVLDSLAFADTLASPAPSASAAVVPAPEPTRRASSAKKKSAPARKVDLNRGDAGALAEVPGIGPKTALAILDYRKAKGGIRDLRELLEVKGIGEKKLERIAPWVTVSGDGADAAPGNLVRP